MSEELNPITREEMFLAKAAGQNVPALTPITRVERFLQNLIDHIKSIGSGGSGGGAFYVTITGDDTNGYTADKTYSEILEAREAGKPVYSIVQSDVNAGMDMIILAFRGIFEEMAVFSGVLEAIEYAVIIADNLTHVASMAFIDLVEIPTELPSPGKLTFNGAVSGSYDGSGDVTITIPTIAGEPGADGYTPVKGTDYYTEADKTEMVELVLAALPTWEGGSY